MRSIERLGPSVAATEPYEIIREHLLRNQENIIKPVELQDKGEKVGKAITANGRDYLRSYELGASHRLKISSSDSPNFGLKSDSKTINSECGYFGCRLFPYNYGIDNSICPCHNAIIKSNIPLLITLMLEGHIFSLKDMFYLAASNDQIPVLEFLKKNQRVGGFNFSDCQFTGLGEKAKVWLNDNGYPLIN